MPPADPVSSTMPEGNPDEHGDGHFQPGDKFGRYTVEALLGEGGMGRVYRALDTTLGRKVALKVIAVAQSDPGTNERTARFQREARSAAALDHPNAVALFDVGEVDGVPFIVMELVTGHSLRRCISSPEIGWPERVRWLVQIASALAAAHRKGIIHRDIKPDNVMIHSDGRAKVLDFGIARRAVEPSDASAGFTQITQEGGVIGTPLYMAPEQLMGELLDGRTDQFSWGVLAYELLTGAPPWTGETVAILSQILSKAPAPLRGICPDMPAEVGAIVLRSLAKGPGDRFSSMDELMSALAPYAAMPLPLGASHSVPPDTSLAAPTPAVTAPPERAHSRKVMVAIGGALVAAALAAAYRWPGSVPPAPPPAAFISMPPPGPTAITDLPSPKSSSTEAIAAYRLGLTRLRAGGDATSALMRAIELDPSLAAAHLQAAFSYLPDGHMEAARDSFREAAKLRSALSARDQALLDAVEPVVHRQPADWGEAIRRLTASLEQYPHDAQLWMGLAFFATKNTDPTAGIRYCDRALAEDPDYLSALAWKGETLAYLGQSAEARNALETCTRQGSAPMRCAATLARMATQHGACDDVERIARQVIAAGNAAQLGYDLLAATLAAQGKPVETVREAQAQAWAHAPEQVQRLTKPRDRFLLSLWAGDFHAAEREVPALVPVTSLRKFRAVTAWWLAELFMETGRTAEAGHVAMEYLSRHDAWEPDPLADDGAITGDFTPQLLAIAQRTGRISRDEFLSRRMAWLTGWEHKTTPLYRNYLWFAAYAAVTETAEDARDALEALPKYSPLPPLRPDTSPWSGAGAAFLLSGRVDEAVTWLEEATKGCHGLWFPIQHVRAHTWLGQAREAKGNKEGACAAYQVVLNRWDKAKPRSVTVEKARTRMKVLGCRK